MSSQKRKQPSSSSNVASSSCHSTDTSLATKAGKQVQQRKGLTVKQTLELRKSSNSSMDAPEDMFLLEIMCLVGLVASQPLFDLPKGSIKEGTTESCPVNTFGDYYGILDYIKNAKIVPFLIKEDPYIDILMSLANKEDYNIIREALSSGKNVSGETYNELVSVCQLLSKDVVIGLLDQIEFKKVTCGFSLVQTPGINPDKSKITEANAISLAIERQMYSRVLVINWDADHSSKVQETFYDRSDVLCISLHRTSTGNPSGSVDEIGSNNAKGRNINCPMPLDDFNSNNLIYAFQHLLMPVALEFQPKVVIVTTSLDFGLARDSKAQITPETYASMVYMLQSLTQGKVAILLECDYTLQYVAPSVYAMTEVLLGLPPKARSGSVVPTKSGADAVASAIKAHAPYWGSLAFHNSSSK